MILNLYPSFIDLWLRKVQVSLLEFATPRLLALQLTERLFAPICNRNQGCFCKVSLKIILVSTPEFLHVGEKQACVYFNIGRITWLSLME